MFNISIVTKSAQRTIQSVSHYVHENVCLPPLDKMLCKFYYSRTGKKSVFCCEEFQKLYDLFNFTEIRHAKCNFLHYPILGKKKHLP